MNAVQGDGKVVNTLITKWQGGNTTKIYFFQHNDTDKVKSNEILIALKLPCNFLSLLFERDPKCKRQLRHTIILIVKFDLLNYLVVSLSI